jgi:ATP-dependent Lhr-like helicase
MKLAATDPLNLVGIITPGERLPASPGNRLLLTDGTPIAVRLGKQVTFLQDIRSEEQWSIRRTLMGPLLLPPAAAARGAS